MIIDAHCHVGQGRFIQQSAEELLLEMDGAGVEMALICPVDEEIVVENRRGNDSILAACRAHPDRFRGLAVANPWYGRGAEDELCRALGEGLAGLKVHPARQGHYVNDEMLDPLLRVVQELDGFVYIHTGTPDYSYPLEAIDVAKRFPTVPVILGHFGGVDIHWHFCGEVLGTCPNVLVETSHLAFTSAVRGPLERFGETRFVFGSDSPIGCMKLEKWKLERMKLAGLEAILGGNAQRLLQQREAADDH